MAGKLPKLPKFLRNPTKRDKNKDQEKENDSIIVHHPEHPEHIGGVNVGPTGCVSIEGTLPEEWGEEFQNQIKAIFSERKEGKFLPGSPVETRKKSQKEGPSIAKGLSTAEILAMMKELCLPGNPWDIYTCVRVCFILSPA